MVDNLKDTVALAEQRSTDVVEWSVDELDAPSADNAFMSDYWNQVDAIVSGIKAVRAAGELYLPRFPDEHKDDYEFRRKSSKMTNVYRDIIEGLSSKPFEEPIKLKDGTPQPIVDFCDDVDGSGNNLTVFSVGFFFNAINSAIDWLFIDYSKPIMSTRPLSVSEEKQAGLRPFWSRIAAKNMLEIKTALIKGKKEFVYARILEPGPVPHVRVFMRDDFRTVWQLWEKQLNEERNKVQWRIVDEGKVSINRIPVVPLIIGRRNGDTWQLFPPMQDAADLQIELYQAETGLKHARILTGFAMLTANGVAPEKEADGKTVKKTRIGPNKILYAPPHNNSGGGTGSFAFIEPAATSLNFLASDIKDTIAQLRELGRQPLTSQSGNLTTITAGVAASKANNAVAMWAYMLADALENALIITALWLAVDYPEPELTVHTDFDVLGDAPDMTIVQAMRAAGDLSRQQLWREGKRRGTLAPDFDPDTELELLTAEELKNATLLTGEGDPNNPGLLPPGKPKPPSAPGSKPPARKPGKPAAVN